MIRVRGPGLICLLLAVAHLGAIPAAAQQPEEPTERRKYLLAAAGAALFAGLALLGGEGHDESACSSTACLLGVGGAAGGVAGYLLGSDLDRRAAARHVGAPALDHRLRELHIPEPPFRLRGVTDGELAVLQDGGISLTDGSIIGSTRAARLRPRDAVLLPGRRLLALAGYSGVYLLPLEGNGAARLLHSEPASAIATLENSSLALGERGRLRRFGVQGRGEGVTLRLEEEVVVPWVPQVMRAPAGGSVWILADDVLVARDPATLEAIGSVELGGRGRDFAIDGSLALVALGSEGAVVVDISDPEAPEPLGRLTGMRSASGVALHGGHGFVAAAAQGLLVYDLRNAAAPALLGVVPDLGLAVAVEVMGGSVYVADRTGTRVLRIDGLPGSATR